MVIDVKYIFLVTEKTKLNCERNCEGDYLEISSRFFRLEFGPGVSRVGSPRPEKIIDKNPCQWKIT